MYAFWYTYGMPRTGRSQRPGTALTLEEIARRWPLAKGSLAEVRKPCIRPQCRACASGRKHPAFIFSFTEAGGRRCLHVPRELVPRLRQALENGRWLEEQMARAGAELVGAYRRERDRRGAAEGGGLP
jgi:hypothetical protein